jgi:hypothetical protein
MLERERIWGAGVGLRNLVLAVIGVYRTFNVRWQMPLDKR